MPRGTDPKPPNQLEKDKPKTRPPKDATTLPSPKPRKHVRPRTELPATVMPMGEKRKVDVAAKMPAHMGSITFEADMPGGNSGMELEILKAIILREDYVARLLEMSQSDAPHALVGAMANTLDLLRITTVEVVEAILQWRKQQQKNLPFKWNGINYLLKLPSDLNFLQQCDVMVRWLGFSMERNPFIMPDNLDKRSDDATPFTPPTTNVGAVDTFLEVGGVPVSPLRPLRSPQAQAARQPKLRSAYETRIINDEELVPRQLTSADANASSTPSVRSRATYVLPSQIGNLDVLRIRAAEKVVLAEEELCGRYARDLYGRIVPEAVAKQQMKTVAIQRAYAASTRELQEASTIEVHEPVVEAPPRPRPTELRKSTTVPSSAQVVDTTKLKQAGMLAPTTKLAMENRIRYPMQRSRGARMEQDLEQARVVNAQLEHHIAHLRDTIAAEEAALPLDTSATSLPTPTLEMLRRDLQVQVDLFARKATEISRKQQAMEAFKLAQKSAAEKQRQAELLRRRHMDEALLALERTKLVEVASATHIQRIIRGILTRQLYKTVRIRFTIASTYIQAGVRGFLARRRVHRLYVRHKAAIRIQCAARGRLARNATRLERLLQQQQKAAIKIQKTFRGKRGRHRMRAYRALCDSKRRMVEIAHNLFEFELVAMGAALCAYAKFPTSHYTLKPSYMVLGVVRLVQSVSLSCMSVEDRDARSTPVHDMRWMEAGQYLRRAARLLRYLTTISAAAARRTIALLPETRTLLEAYKNDVNFGIAHLASAALGAMERPSTLLLEWITHLDVVQRVQSTFLSATPVCTLDLSQYEADDRAEDAKCALEDYHSERQFVPLALIQDCPKRTRPILLVLSRELPGHAKDVLVAHINAAFPGLFLRINSQDPIALATMQPAFDAGYSVLLDADIGLSIGQQRIFLGQFAIVSRALRPTPLSILLQGSLANRAGLGYAAGTYGVSELDASVMVDGDAKHEIQLAADGLHTLTSGRLDKEMVTMSTMDCPPVALVLVMEATLILLTPSQRFVSPANTTSTVTWRLSRRLLSAPAVFTAMLQALDVQYIPYENVAVLREYLDLAEWPVDNDSTGTLLFRLALFVRAVTRYAHAIQSRGGAAEVVTRTKPIPGLFSNVITITDPVDEDDWSYKDAMAQITSAILQDVRVHRQSVKIGDRYHVVSLYRDCHRVYVTVYDPLTSHLLRTEIPETFMNTLLAPNSFEAAQNKQAPSTPLELYQRVVGFTTLAKPKGINMQPIVELRPHAVRLTKVGRHIHGHFASIVVSEIALGHVRLGVFVHDVWSAGRLAWTLDVDEAFLQQLKLDASDPLELQAYQDMNVQALYQYVLDRVHIEAAELSKPVLHHVSRRVPRNIVTTPHDLRVRIRKHGGSGRLLLRSTMHLRPQALRWVVSVFDISMTETLRIEAYRPEACIKRSVLVSSRERHELLLSPRRVVSTLSPLWLQHILSQLVMTVDGALALDLELTTTGFYLPLHPDHSKLARKPGIKVIVSAKLCAMASVYGLSLHIYFPITSTTHELRLADAQIQSAISLVWPSTSAIDRRRVILALLGLCAYDTDECVVRLTSPSGFVEFSVQIRPVPSTSASAAVASAPVIDTRPRDAASIDVDLLQNTVRMLDAPSEPLVLVYDAPLRVHSSSYRCNGTLLRVDVTMTAYLKPVREPNKPGLPDILREADWFDMALSFYHPDSSTSCEAHVDGLHDLREVAGPDAQDLVGSGTVPELLRHIVMHRLDRTLSDDALRVVLVRSRMFTHRKATPVNAAMDADAFAQDGHLIELADARGIKLLSQVKHLRQHAVICTVFDVTPTNAKRDAALALRVDGYIAASSKQLSMWINGAALREAIGADVHLMREAEAQNLAAHVVDLLDVEVNGDEIYRLYVKEVITPSSRLGAADEVGTDKTRKAPCLLKAIRTVGGQRVLLGVYDTQSATPDAPLRVDFYQPSSSLSTSFAVPLTQLRTHIARGADWDARAMSKDDLQSALHEMLSHLNVAQVEMECGTNLFVEWASVTS
ncbi:hypothetical protein SDRG_10876 [Saprolegnia diclina VS20]|uniref:Calmodulin n=1 Tax=Saprolegnia diclina (strain VS20) TaxID=1156394 RepID=T0Q9C9_SAPDV|nr:hypothetical protein SDRG_10876 [Saprolegnia diclina VS20]EQC31271.1 hypothetical protein SDRG_10876 [Saprolegnia diclina VS20]|eukprot:XP_008615112.1 hypothetical protein SDRG_10876 [Saprolegnia diclina VS20]